MSASALRIVEGSSMDKTKALSAALSQIERQFGWLAGSLRSDLGRQRDRGRASIFRAEGRLGRESDRRGRRSAGWWRS